MIPAFGKKWAARIWVIRSGWVHGYLSYASDRVGGCLSQVRTVSPRRPLDLLASTNNQQVGRPGGASLPGKTWPRAHLSCDRLQNEPDIFGQNLVTSRIGM